MELLDVQPMEEELLLDGEAEQQERPTSSSRDGRGRAATCRGWPRRSYNLQGMAKAEQYELVDSKAAQGHAISPSSVHAKSLRMRPTQLNPIFLHRLGVRLQCLRMHQLRAPRLGARGSFARAFTCERRRRPPLRA
jgi:hypothetical protein